MSEKTDSGPPPESPVLSFLDEASAIAQLISRQDEFKVEIEGLEDAKNVSHDTLLLQFSI